MVNKKTSTAYEKIGAIVFKLNPKLKGIMISAVNEDGKEYPRVSGIYIKNKNLDVCQEKAE